MHRSRIARATLLAIALLAGTMAPAAAQVDENSSITVTGHGWGHGRGMSQYGALGYAIDYGWSSQQILDHYYGDTTAGSVPNSVLTVRIESASDQATVAGVDSGAMVLIDDDGDVTHIGTGRAIRLTAVGGGFAVADAPTCAGPFTERPGVLASEEVRISTATAQRSGGRATVGAGLVIEGDWDGDGADEVGTVDGTSWTIYSDGPSSPAASVLARFTMPAGVPVSGDWDGDGVDTAGVFVDGTWTLGMEPPTHRPSRMGRQATFPWSVIGMAMGTTISVSGEARTGSCRPAAEPR